MAKCRIYLVGKNQTEKDNNNTNNMKDNKVTIDYYYLQGTNGTLFELQ